MSRIENQILKQIGKEYIDGFHLKKFLIRKINSKLFRETNRREIIKLLPKIMEKTNEENYYWLDSLIFLLDEPAMLDILIENIPKIQFKEENTEKNIIIFDYILELIKDSFITEEQIKKLIDNIPECKILINPATMNFLYSIIEDKYPNLITEMLEKYIKIDNTCNATIYVIDRKGDKKLIYENIDFILNDVKDVDLFYLRNIVKDNQEINQKIIDKIEENEDESVHILVKRIMNTFINVELLKQQEKGKINTIIDVIYLIIQDICKNEHVSVSSIEELGAGAYSIVLGVGSKVIKIGNKRGTKKFPNNPYINATLLRKEFKINEESSIFVEVNERVDTKIDVSEQELYELYKKLRDIHLVWADVAVRNVGRLTKNNEINWREELPLTNERLGFQEYRYAEPLKKGDIVILDNDFIFDENEIYHKDDWPFCPLQRIFERRYQNEKKSKIKSNDKISDMEFEDMYQVQRKNR